MSLNRLVLGVPCAEVTVLATGGVATPRAQFIAGERTGETVKFNGAEVRRVTGLAVSIDGRGLDGAVVETTTVLDEVAAGTVFRAEGETTVTVRAEAQAGFGGGAPRASLVTTVFVERLVPVGNVSELLRASARPTATTPATAKAAA